MNKVIKSSLFNIILALFTVPIYFIMIPYTISEIGAEGYGLYALIGVISSYQIFVEMGLTTALTRYVAKANICNDYIAIEEYLSTILIIFLIISGIAIFIIISLKELIVIKILGLKINVDAISSFVVLSAITGVINLVSGVFKSLIDGLQRMDISSIILTIQLLISSVGTILFLEFGFGLKGLIINGFIVSLICLFANIIVSKYLISYKINIFIFHFSRFKEMFKFSFNMQLSSLVYFFIEPLNKVLISNYISVSYVGYYDIALKFVSRITALVRSALTPLFPAASEIYEKYGVKGVENLHIKSARIIYPALIGLFVIVFVLIDPFIKLWLKTQAEYVIPAIVILLSGSFFTLLATTEYTLLLGSGFSNVTLRIQAQSAIVNVISVMVFSYLFGFYGFCAGYSVSMVYIYISTQREFRRIFNTHLKIYGFILNKRIIYCTLIMIGLGLIGNKFLYLYSGWINLIGFSIFFGAFYIYLFYKFNIIEESEIKKIIGEKLYKSLKILLKEQ